MGSEMCIRDRGRGGKAGRTPARYALGMRTPSRAPRRAWLALALALVPAAAAGCGRAPRPNLLLITVDSLRRDHAGPYGWRHPQGGDEPVTPVFDRLAREGALFEDAVSTTSWTLPAHMALMTGLADELHGVTDNFRRLNPEHRTLAELLAGHGYATGGFFSGPNLHPAFGFAQGFEVYRNCSGIEAPADLFESQELGVFRPVHQASHATVTSPALLQEAGAWIAEVARGGERPFFAFVHCWDPHYDYRAPEPYGSLFTRPYAGELTGTHATDSKRAWGARDREHLLGLYDGEARWTDEHLGALLERLEELGVLDDTLVILTSDHGEEFYERGRWGHQRTLYDEVVRIPLALRWPGRVPAGLRPRGQARIQDLLPTVAELFDLPLAGALEGRSLVPLLEDPDHPGYPQPLHLRVPYREIHLSGLRTGAAKVLWDHEQESGWLVDLTSDPLELQPRPFDAAELESSADPALAAYRASRAALDELRARLPGAWEGVELPPELLDDLRAVGYLGDG